MKQALSTAVVLELPAGIPLQQVVLAATQGPLRINNQAELRSAAGAGLPASLSGSNGVQVGTQALVGSIVSFGPVALSNGAAVYGDVSSGGDVALQAGAQVLGSIDEFAVLESQSLRFDVNLPEPPPLQLVVSGGETADAAPGRYSRMTAQPGSVLNLVSGVYVVDSLIMESSSRIVVRDAGGPIQFVVLQEFVHRGEVVSATRTRPSWFVLYLGANGAFIETPFDGAIVAPNALVALRGAPGTHRGSFWAREIDVGDRASVTHAPFQDWPAVCAALGGSGGVCAPSGGGITVPPSSEVFDLTFVTLPDGVAGVPGFVAVSGSSGVSVGNGSLLDGGAGTAVVVAGEDGANLGNNVRVPGLVARGDVSVGTGVTVSGGIVSTGAVDVSGGTLTEGEIEAGADIPGFGAIRCSTVFGPPERSGLFLASGRSRIAFPSRYGEVTVQSGAKLYLKDGIYHFETLVVDPGGQIVLGSGGGLTTLFVRARLSVQGSITRLGTGIGGADLFVGYAGVVPATIAGAFRGSVLAPRAELRLANDTAPEGSFFAQRVAVGDRVTLTSRAAPIDLVCGQPAVDAAVVRRGGSLSRLTARFEHATGQGTPGVFEPPQPVSFRIRDRLLVSAGNAGNHPATLSFEDATGTRVSCSYVGGAGVARPTTRLEAARGLEYRFVSCSNGLAPGDAASGTDFSLSIQGDAQFPVGTHTEVSLAVDAAECQPYLGSFIPPGEAVEMFESFSWNATQPLEENNPDGTPALYYASVYVENAEAIDRLDALLIHNQPFPLFQSEYPRDFFGNCGPVNPGGDAEGEWLFAVLPGAAYNAIRRLVVDTEGIEVENGDRVLFDAIVLREVPPAAANPNGSLNYAILREAGFQWRLRGTNVSVLPDAAALDETALQGGAAVALVVDAFEFVLDTTLTVVGLAMEALAYVDAFLSGSVDVQVDVDVTNPDALFGGARLTRAWGPQGGTELGIRGATINLFQGVSRLYTLGIPIPTLYSRDASSAGVVNFDVAQNSLLGQTLYGGLCITAHNDATRMAYFVVPSFWCDVPSAEILDGQADPTGETSTIFFGFSEDSRLRLDIEDVTFHALAEFTEARDYAGQVLGNAPPKAHVLVGWAANGVLFSQSAAALCFRVSGFRASDAFDTETLFGAFTGAALLNADNVADPIPAAYMALATANDILLPSGGSIERTRGVGTHEYGHFILCSELASQTSALSALGAPRGELFTKLYVQTVFEGTEVNPGNAARIINEGFADFIAGQVVGGTNYFTTGNSTNGVIRFCDGTGSVCLDQNVPTDPVRDAAGGTATVAARNEIGRVTTTLHDVLDGHYANTFVSSVKRSATPTNADFHRGSGIGGNLIYTPTSYGNREDELVALGGRAVAGVVSEFLERTQLRLIPNPFSNDNFSFSTEALRSAIAATLREQGASWCDACRVMALHEPGAPENLPLEQQWQICLASDFADALGSPPDPTLTLDGNSCTPCATGSVRGASGADSCQARAGLQVAGPCAATTDGAGVPLAGNDIAAQVCQIPACVEPAITDCPAVPGPCSNVNDAFGNPVVGTDIGGVEPRCVPTPGSSIAGPCAFTQDGFGNPLVGADAPATHCELTNAALVVGPCGNLRDAQGQPVPSTPIGAQCRLDGIAVLGPCALTQDGAGAQLPGTDFGVSCSLAATRLAGPCASTSTTAGNPVPAEQGPFPQPPQCQACPAGLAADRATNTCAACGAGEIVDIDATCSPCPAEAIVVANACAACPLGTGPDAARLSCIPCPADATVDLASVGTCSQLELGEPPASGSDACPAQFWVDVTAPSTRRWGVTGDFANEPTGAACSGTSITTRVFDTSNALLAEATEAGSECVPPQPGELCGGLPCLDVCGDDRCQFTREIDFPLPSVPSAARILASDDTGLGSPLSLRFTAGVCIIE